MTISEHDLTVPVVSNEVPTDAAYTLQFPETKGWKARTIKDVEDNLEEALKSFEQDAGSKALEALRTVRVKNRAKTVRRRWIGFWVLLLLAVALEGVGHFLFLNIKMDHHSAVRSCIMKYGDTNITGTREFDYPARSLFGWELVSHDEVESRTKITLKGDKMTIIGLDNNRKIYWRVNVSAGDRGEQILKPANEYIFLGDKADAMITSDAFCK